MSTEGVWVLAGVGTLCAAGFLAGLAHPRFRSAPLVASSVVIAGYVVLLVVTGLWVAACPGCTSHISYDSARPVDLVMALFWGALFTAGVILFVLAGVGVAALFQRLGRVAHR